MNKENIRLVFWAIIFALGFMLYNAWQTEHPPVAKSTAPQEVVSTKAAANNEIPVLINADAQQETTAGKVINNTEIKKDTNRIVHVKTDVYDLQIDALGGDIVYLELPKYPESLGNTNQGFVLLDETKDLFYIMQTGLLNENGPDSNTHGRALYKFNSREVAMGDDESVLNVDFNYFTNTGVKVTKRYIFTRGSYQINVHYLIDNKSSADYQVSAFGRIKRNAPEKESSGMFGAMKFYTGAAVNTTEKKCQKISFSDMEKKPFQEDVNGGWAAMVQHYFVTAMVPAVDAKNYYQSEVFDNDVFGIRFVSEAKVVPAGGQDVIETKLYAGPELAQQLKSIAPGLELTIDYGILWFICQPIFWLLKTMFDVFGNWGVAIIVTTVLIKAMFYKLSASSYKSMGNMRKLQPKIEALKQRYGDDRQQFSQAMMELYRKEKVNPLGGCLPILVQIPVFIALYYVLLESVELRQAPFVWWIHDLSAKDPFYVLPIIMGLSMLVQQRLNPQPPDPMQAKVMMFMPVFFTFLFLQFPAGLVLYWVVNNLLSILQQWIITRRIEKHSK